MKHSSLSLPAAATALLTAAVFAVTTVAQAPQTSQSPTGSPTPEQHNHTHAAPTNLKVLPKNLTGEQVHEIMEQWESELGAHCNTCHAVDPNNIGPNGRPRLNYADDSKPEKATARLMYTMTEDINKNYVSKFDTSGSATVACGTCHRGHLQPEQFVAPDHDGPRTPQSPSQMPPAAASPAKPQ